MEEVPPIRYTESGTSRSVAPPTTRKTSGKGVLYGIIGLLLLVLIILAVIFGFSFFFPIKLHVVHAPGRLKRHFGNEKKPEYLQAARRLRSMLNFSVNPCEDFYEFACGKVFVAEGEIPSNISFTGYTRIQMQLDKELDLRLEGLLTSEEVSSSKAIEKHKMIYKACIKNMELPLDLDKSSRNELKYLRCFAGLKNEVYNAVWALYARKYANQEAKRRITEIAANLRKTFFQIIKETDWLDEMTRQGAGRKLSEMIIAIGFSDAAFNDTALDAEYDGLNITEEMSHMDMIQEYERWKATVPPKICSRCDISANPAKVAPKYRGPTNTAFIHGGMFEEPYFDLESPKALNYGAIGSIIGHEITHGLIDREYDEIGTRRNWWSNSSIERFEEIVKRMVEQYNNFIIKENGQPVNGEWTLGENISDNGGIKASFRAYKEYLAKNEKEGIIPGFDFTSEQLFFIGYGHGRCAKDTLSSLAIMMKNNHAPYRARVNVVVSNQAEFAEAFNCPLGSPMNPVNKVSVW